MSDNNGNEKKDYPSVENQAMPDWLKILCVLAVVGVLVLLFIRIGDGTKPIIKQPKDNAVSEEKGSAWDEVHYLEALRSVDLQLSKSTLALGQLIEKPLLTDQEWKNTILTILLSIDGNANKFLKYKSVPTRYQELNSKFLKACNKYLEVSMYLKANIESLDAQKLEIVNDKLIEAIDLRTEGNNDLDAFDNIYRAKSLND